METKYERLLEDKETIENKYSQLDGEYHTLLDKHNTLVEKYNSLVDDYNLAYSYSESQRTIVAEYEHIIYAAKRAVDKLQSDFTIFGSDRNYSYVIDGDIKTVEDKLNGR